MTRSRLMAGMLVVLLGGPEAFVPAAAGQAEACTGENCMSGDDPVIDCKGENCLPRQENPVVECSGENCAGEPDRPMEECAGEGCSLTNAN